MTENLEPIKKSFFVLCILVTSQMVMLEEFFQTRDRKDNVQYRVLNDKNIVTSTEKAQEILKRYGYLRCGASRRRGSGLRTNEIRAEGRPSRRCSEEEIRQAIRQYQYTYNMAVTGRLDQATLRMMSESRCGNPDDENAAVPYKPMINPKRRHWRKSHSYQPLARHRRETLTNDINTESKSMQLSIEKAFQELNTKRPESETVVKAVPLHDIVMGVQKNILADRNVESLPAGTPLTRRRRWLERYVEELENGESDKKVDIMHDQIQKRRRKKRSTPTGIEGQAFTTEVVTWRLIGSAYSNQLTVNTQRAALALAFRMWGEVIPLVFLEDTRSPVDDVDILIAFGRGEHLNCPNHFDGFGGQLSHAIKMSANAEIHVDDDEYLTVGSEQGTNLVKVAVHEVGHALGLFHTSRNYSIMYAIYSQVIPNNNFELGWEDRKLVQNIYGICEGKFDTMFDWVRRRPDGQLIYNTYFFRDFRYWMYENRFNRTRYGDPLHIMPEWKGIPDKVDGYAHVWTYTQDSAYFFKGQQYWLYNSAEDRIVSGYPRNISADFRAVTGSGFRNIPGNIDSVFFDKRDGNLYFFKDNLVYAYDVSRGNEGCCLPGYPRTLSQEFPSVNKESSLPSNLDAVYFSYTDRSMYFLKGTYYWHNVAFNPLDRRRTNRVSGPWLLSSKWYDICDVEV